MSKTALITGAANGIGRAIALALAEQSMHLILFDSADSSQTLDLLDAKNASARAVRGDVSNESDVLALFSQIDQQERTLDVAVNCAGIQFIRPLVETTAADFDRVMSVNARGTFLVARESARRMLKQPPGSRIINIASELAYLGRANYSAYCASKSAIIALTRSWAREFAPHILVNAVAPGPTDTQMLSAEAISSEQLGQEISSVPLGRIASTAEIAAAVAFLAGPGATYFTGQCISPSGGAIML
jgi:3-oxoacyl-[acyl-carrier protein] reductase